MLPEHRGSRPHGPALHLQGAAFGLTARERTFAAGAGILFAAAALATILL